MENDIQIGDLDGVVRLIDLCSTRGAFQGPELAQVGQLREKFAAVVRKFVEEQQKQEAAKNEGGAVTAPVPPKAADKKAKEAEAA